MRHPTVPVRLPAAAYGLALLAGLASCTAEDELDPFADLLDDTGFRQVTAATDDPLPPSVLDDINATLPESQDATVAHPELFPAGFDPNPQVVSADTDVWVTFVQEGATYHSAMGYFTYPAGNPPASLTLQQLEDGLIFADASGTGPGLAGGGTLENGARMSLGTFQPGVQIGFYLVRNGACDDPGVGTCSSLGVDFTLPVYTTVDAMNPEYATDPGLARHVVMADLLGDPASDSRLLAFEDQDRLGGPDDDFNDVIFRVTASPALEDGGPTIPPTTCGNGIIEEGEQCDDGNLVDSDGCNDSCELEVECTASGSTYDAIQPGNWAFDVWDSMYPDINGDGLADHCTTGEHVDNYGIRSWCSIGYGNGSFGDPVYHQLQTGNWAFDVWNSMYPDINGDGLADHCTTGEHVNGYGVRSYCSIGDGTGHFADSVYHQTQTGNWAFDVWNSMYPDINGDGLADHCTTGEYINGYGVRSYCSLGDGTGHFSAPVYHQTLTGNWGPAFWDSMYPDINGDGLADHCTTGEYIHGYGVRSYCSLGDGTGHFSTSTYHQVQTGNWGYEIWNSTYPDVNGDGLADHCTTGEHVGGYGVRSYCSLGDGTGHFSAPVYEQTQTGNWGSSIWDSMYPDIDGDGFVDHCTTAEHINDYGVRSYCSKGFGDGTFGAFPICE